MKLKRKIFINSKNGQASLTIPKKVILKLKEESTNKKFPRVLSIEVLNNKEKKEVKKW